MGVSAATSKGVELDAMRRGKWSESCRHLHHQRPLLELAPLGGSRALMVKSFYDSLLSAEDIPIMEHTSAFPRFSYPPRADMRIRTLMMEPNVLTYGKSPQPTYCCI